MAQKPTTQVALPVQNSPEFVDLSTAERSRLIKLRSEIQTLRKKQLNAKEELDATYMEWEKLDTLIRDGDTTASTSDLKQLMQARDAATDAFDAATETFETRVAELLAVPENESFVRHELVEIEKREAYQSSQTRGEGTTYGSSPHYFLHYQLKKSSIVKVSGENNPVYYPELKRKGCVDPDKLLAFMTATNGVNESSVMSVMAELRKAVLFFTRMGLSVNMFDLFTVSPSLRGTCTQAETDAYFHRSFTPFLTAKASPKMTRMFRANLGARNGRKDTGGVVISGVFACPGDGSLITAEAFAPGEIMQIFGAKINYNLSNADEGYFLCSTSGQTKYKVPRTGLPKDIVPSRASLFFPKEAIPGETLQLVLRKRLKNSATLRTYSWDTTFTVK